MSRTPVKLGAEHYEYTKPRSPSVRIELVSEYAAGASGGSMLRSCCALLGASTTVGPMLKVPFAHQRLVEYGQQVADVLINAGVTLQEIYTAAAVVYDYLCEDLPPMPTEVFQAAGN